MGVREGYKKGGGEGVEKDMSGVRDTGEQSEGVHTGLKEGQRAAKGRESGGERGQQGLLLLLPLLPPSCHCPTPCTHMALNPC